MLFFSRCTTSPQAFLPADGPEVAIVWTADLPFQLQILTLSQMSDTRSLFFYLTPTLLQPWPFPDAVWSPEETFGVKASSSNSSLTLTIWSWASHFICVSPHFFLVIVPASWGFCKTSTARSGIEVTIRFTEHSHVSSQRWVSWNMFHFEHEGELDL